MEVKTAITVEIPGLQRFRRVVTRGDGSIKKAYNQWALRYRSFIQRRYNKFSRGGGNWAPLTSRQGSILRDTNTLFTALTPSLTPPAGSINKPIEGGIEVGYGGPSGHPGGPTIVQLAFWHQTGAGNYPAREIIVAPDSDTIRGMVQDMQRAVNEESPE